MRQVRFFFVMAMLSIGMLVATNPVFAAAGGNGNGNGGCGNGNGNGNTCNPGNPVLPEAPFAVILPIVGLVIVGLVLFAVYRRRQHTLDTVAE